MVANTSPTCEPAGLTAALRGTGAPVALVAAGGTVRYATPAATLRHPRLRPGSDLASALELEPEGFAAAMRDALRTSEPTPMRLRAVAGGSLRVFMTRAGPDEVLLRLAGAEPEPFTDLTERVQVLSDRDRRRVQELRRTERLLAEAQAIASLGSFEREIDTGRATLTVQVPAMFGVPPGEVNQGDASRLRELIDPADRPQYLNMLEAVAETGRADTATFRIRRPDGEERVLQTRARRTVDDGVGKVVGTIQDITESHRLQEEIIATRDLFAGVLDAATETAIIATDAEGRITVFNRGAERMLAREAAQVLGSARIVDFHDPGELAARAVELGVAAGPEVLFAAARAGSPETREWSHVRGDGDRVTVSLTVSAIRGAGDEVLGFIGIARDVTEVRRAEAARREAEKRFELAFEHAPIGVAILGIEGHDRGRFMHTNEALNRMLGREPGELDGTTVAAVTHADDGASTEHMLEKLDTLEPAQTEARYMHRDGRDISVLVSSTPVLDDDDRRPLYCVTQVLDISERKRFEGQLRYLADHDALTGLYNRHRFESELQRMVEENRRYARGCALLLLDLDGFKFVNDRFGHPVGDELVTRIAGLLRETVRDTDVVARLGGDEFAIVLHEAGEPQAGQVAQKLLDAIRRHGIVMIGQQCAQVTTSIGITTLSESSDLTGQELVVEADIAMYDAKEQGRDRWTVYDRSANRREVVSKRHSWLTRIRSALAEDQFVLHAQPIHGICGNGIPRWELLLRMRDPEDGLIPPGAFLYNAERFDLMGAIDRWVLGHAVQLLHEHSRAGHAISLAVNISGKTMNDVAFADDLAKLLAAAPVPEGRLVVEVTETAAIVNISRARELADQLRGLGCLFALDDFGAGFASFYYLKHLDFDYLKIDGEFITELVASATDQLVVRAVVDIARGLGTQTIAEFVKDDATVDLLRTLGVDYGQGYHLGRPGPLALELPSLG